MKLLKFTIKIISYFLQALLIYLFFLIGSILRLRLSRIFFSNLFKNVGPVFKSKTIINKNLKYFSKNISNQDSKKIIENMWENYGKTFIEYIFLRKFRNNNDHIELVGLENLDNIIKRGKPVIFVSGHFANFELMSMEITKRNIKLATIYRPLNNFFLNPFMEYLRRKYVCADQIKKGINGVRDAINYIKKNYSVALMIDQRVSEGERVPFFKNPALTTTLPAQLSKKYNLSILPVFIERRGENFRIEFYESIKPSDYNNKLDLTLKLNEVIETMITKNPHEWIWTHNRWK